VCERRVSCDGQNIGIPAEEGKSRKTCFRRKWPVRVFPGRKTENEQGRKKSESAIQGIGDLQIKKRTPSTRKKEKARLDPDSGGKNIRGQESGPIVNKGHEEEKEEKPAKRKKPLDAH